MHYKNRKPKKYKGCCWMCASRDRQGGCRNKRNLTMQEKRFRGFADQQERESKQAYKRAQFHPFF